MNFFEKIFRLKVKKWDDIYSDMGVKNIEELHLKLNKITTKRILEILANRIPTNDIVEIYCIGIYPFLSNELEKAINEIKSGYYCYKDVGAFIPDEDYYIIYQIISKSGIYILIEKNSYNLYVNDQELTFFSINQKIETSEIPSNYIIYSK